MATRYEFPSMVAKDPSLDTTVRDGNGQVYALLDTAFGTPLPTYDRYGSVKATINTTPDGQTEEFYVDDQPVVWWKSGAYAFVISSHTGMLAAAQHAQAASQAALESTEIALAATQSSAASAAAAQAAAIASQVAAQAAQQAAETYAQAGLPDAINGGRP